jgi:hypothetical protein
MNLRFTQLTLGPIGWAMVIGAGLVLGYGLSNLGIFVPLALVIGVAAVLGTLFFLDRRTASRLAKGRVQRRRAPRRR